MSHKIIKNIPWGQPFLGKDERALALSALDSSWISNGPYVERFEKDFARTQRAKFCMTTSSGTSALFLALQALGIGPGDEVIVPGFSFMAPAHMVMAMGAKPIFADIDEHTWCIDPICVQQKISVKTKAIVAVHTYGNVCDILELTKICRRHKIFLVEDVAEAVFSRYEGQLAGTFGDIGCYSFQAAKTITMGEGGCVVTGNKNWHDAMRLIRNHGMSPKRRYWHDVVGHNFRLTNIQAALGCAQLKNCTKILSAKRKVYDLYCQYLAKKEGVTLQYFKPGVQPIVWCAAMRLDPKVFGSRDAVMKRFQSQGIETRPGFYPASQMPLYKAGPLPIAERVSAQVITLPSFVSLTGAQIKFICDQL